MAGAVGILDSYRYSTGFRERLLKVTGDTAFTQVFSTAQFDAGGNIAVFEPVRVPEPSTLALLALGFAGAALRRSGRRV